MKKKLMSIALSAVLAGSAAAPCFAAETVAASAASESLAEIVQAGLPDEVIPTETPTADCVSYECSYSYEGVAVTCADIEALKENGLNGVPVEWSDGIWSSYWCPSGTEFLIQPLEGLAKEFGFYGKYEHFGDEVQDDGKENSFPIPAECTGLDEPVYVLYTPKADAARLEAALASDSTVTVIGALFCGILQPVNGAGIILDVMPYRAAATTAKIVPFTPKAPAADAAEQYDIAAYAEEHFRRSDGAALYFLDPTRWYAREITKAPDFANNEGIAYLYADDLGEKYLTGDWSGSLMIAVAYSLFNFDLCGVSEEENAAFDALMTDFAASRETLVYLHDAQAPRQLYDYALHTDTAEQLTDALKAQPDVKALISQIQYTPVFVDTVNISTIDGLKFMTPDGDYLSEDRLRVLEYENDLSWTVNDAGGVSPETVTTESLIELVSVVANADPVILRPSPLAESSNGVQNDDVRMLYQKGDADGDGNTDAAFADETEKAFCERIAGWENVSLSDCILLHPQDGDLMLLTPDKPYSIGRIRAGCYRIYTDGAAPDADVVLAKWKEMLRIAGYPEKTLERFKCEITEADGGYDVQVNQDSYGKCSIIECLKQFPAVKKIDAQFGYRTDDHVNGSSCWHFLFQCDREPVPADFPSLNVYSIALSDSNWFDGWEMYLDTESYADYYAAARTMLESKIVRDLHFSYISTLLLDDNDDAQILLPERTVVWERGASGETARRGPVKVSPQFLEWNPDEEALKNGEPGSFAGTATQFLLVGLAFRWSANGTPVGAEIGGCTLTAADGWLNQTKGLVEDIHTFAAALPDIEHYDECTPYVPDDLLESGLWIAGGILDEAFAAALLNDPRIDAQGLLYITETKDLYLDAHGEAALEEDLRFDEISACLRPLEFAEIGDVDGDGKVTAYDATLALTAFSEKTAGYADGERTLTPAQEQIADVDGDGELTAFDATMILTYFNLKYNTGYDDLTWADVLPET